MQDSFQFPIIVLNLIVLSDNIQYIFMLGYNLSSFCSKQGFPESHKSYNCKSSIWTFRNIIQCYSKSRSAWLTIKFEFFQKTKIVQKTEKVMKK